MTEPESKEEEEEEQEEIFHTPLEIMLPRRPTLQIRLTALDQNAPTNDEAPSFFDFEQFWTWLHNVKPLIVPFVLILITPWWMTKFLILPLFLWMALRVLERLLTLIFDTKRGMLRRSGRIAKALTRRAYDLLELLEGIFFWGPLLPWKMWLGLYMLWVIGLVMNLARAEERKILLACHLAMLCVLPVVIWKGIAPWLAWRAAGISLRFLQSLLTRALKVSTAYMVVATAHKIPPF